MNAQQIKPSGIILAGGMSRRLGRNKAIETVGGQPLISRVIARINQISDDLVVVIASPTQISDLTLSDHITTAVDIFEDKGSLGGIYTGLLSTRNDWAFIASCDMPFLNVNLIREMWNRRQSYDAIVPILDARPEPTHAFYSKKCLPYIKDQLELGDLKISRMLNLINVDYVPQQDLEVYDPKHLSFFNINTQEDLDRAMDLSLEEQQ